MRIIAFGDIHMAADRFSSIPGAQDADLIIITGDLTNFGGKKEAGTILEQIRAINPHIAAVSGNLDHLEVEDYLADEGVSLHGQGKIIGDIGLFGVGGSNPTPFNTPNERSEAEILSLLRQGYESVRSARFHIMVSHPPPFDTATDKIGAGAHVGSKGVRACIEELEPDVCLCGHIHEAKGQDTIGRSVILNPGLLEEGGWVELNLTDNGLSSKLHIQ